MQAGACFMGLSVNIHLSFSLHLGLQFAVDLSAMIEEVESTPALETKLNFR